MGSDADSGTATTNRPSGAGRISTAVAILLDPVTVGTSEALPVVPGDELGRGLRHRDHQPTQRGRRIGTACGGLVMDADAGSGVAVLLDLVTVGTSEALPALPVGISNRRGDHQPTQRGRTHQHCLWGPGDGRGRGLGLRR